jgi:hypothetical protein
MQYMAPPSWRVVRPIGPPVTKRAISAAQAVLQSATTIGLHRVKPSAGGAWETWLVHSDLIHAERQESD